MSCNVCNTDKNVKTYTERDDITDICIGSVDLCDECAEDYEELNEVSISIE